MSRSSFAERHLHILFPLPALVFVAMLMVFPVLYTFFLSFTNWNLTSGTPAEFVGLRSYTRVLTEPRFLHALARTFAFTFFAVAIEGVLGVAAALILNRAFVGRSLAKLSAAAAAGRHARCGRDRVQPVLRPDHRPAELRSAVVRIASGTVDIERYVGPAVA